MRTARQASLLEIHSRQISGEHFEEHRADAVHVAFDGRRLAASLFGAHVRERSDDARGCGHRKITEVGDAEIAEARDACAVEQNVGGLHVAMKNFEAMRFGERAQDRACNLHRARWP